MSVGSQALPHRCLPACLHASWQSEFHVMPAWWESNYSNPVAPFGESDMLAEKGFAAFRSDSDWHS